MNWKERDGTGGESPGERQEEKTYEPNMIRNILDIVTSTWNCIYKLKSIYILRELPKKQQAYISKKVLKFPSYVTFFFQMYRTDSYVIFMNSSFCLAGDG